MQDSQLFLDISLDLLRSGHRIHFRAEGQSMQPAIQDGDMLTVAPIAPEQVRAGDVLLYCAARGLLVHRVVRVVRVQKCGTAEHVVILRGDASDTCDDPVPVSRILGKVVQIDRDSGAGVQRRWARGAKGARWARTAVHKVLKQLIILKNRVSSKIRLERASQLR